jgi:hypothetical protein
MMLSRDAFSDIGDYVLTQTRHVIENFGPRTPGSAAEREAQAYVAECLSAMEPDEVTSESFPVAAKAFMAFQPATGALLLISAVIYWISPPLALLLTAFGFLITWYEFIHYRLLLDPLMPQSESVNVFARWAPKGETRRRIIINAHTDAAFEWRYHYHWPRVFPWIVRYCLLGIVVKVLLDIVAVAVWFLWPESSALFYLGLGQVLLVPGFILAFGYTDFTRTVPGANDNLSGVFIALGVARALREAGVTLEHTELACLITGSEEAGLRGAKAWSARHAGEYDDCETAILTLDTFHGVEHMAVLERDLNATVKNDPDFSALVQDAAKTCGYDIPCIPIPLGSSDAAAFTQGGFTSTALCAMDPAPAHFYHTRLDDWDNMDAECIAAAAGVVTEVIRRFETESG